LDLRKFIAKLRITFQGGAGGYTDYPPLARGAAPKPELAAS